MARGAAGEAVYEPQVPAEDLPRKHVPEMSGASFGSGVTQIADVLEKKYQADSATWAGDQLSAFRQKAISTLDTMKQSLPPGDPGNFTEKYLAQFDKDAQPLVEQSGSNPYARRMMQQGVTQLRDTLADHTLTWEAQQRVAYRADSVQTNLQSQLPLVQAHPELADQVGSTIADQIRAVGGGNEKMLPMMRDMHQKLSQAAADGLSRQDPKGMLDALTNPENASPMYKSAVQGLSDPQREAMIAKAQMHVSQGASDNVVATYRAQGPIAGAKALASIEQMDASPEIKAQARADAEKGIAQWHSEMRQTHADTIMGLEERLASGKPNINDGDVALSLFHSGALDAPQAGEMRGRIEKAQEKQVDDDAWVKYTGDAYSKGQGLDPQDKNIRSGIAEVFKRSTVGVPPGTAEWINKAADISQKTGVTPDSAIEWSRTALVSSDPAVAARAAQSIQRFTDANPRGIGFAMDSRTKAMAALVNNAVQAGTDPKSAIENARALTTIPEAESKRLDALYKPLAQKAPGDLGSQLKDTDSGFRSHFWQGIPDIPPQMTGQFQELRRDYFKLTGGNVDQANKLATADLKNTWGITQVNGKKEFMQYAPEAMNPGLTTDAVRTDMEKSATGHALDPKAVRLLEIPETAQSGGQRWGLGVPDKFGAFHALTDERGRVIPYQLPTATQGVKDAQAKASTDGMAKLHALQEIERAREKNELGEVYMQGRRAGY